MHWGWILGRLLGNDVFNESYEPVDYSVLVCAESCVLVAHHGEVQDASLCLDWVSDVLGKLCVVLGDETEEGTSLKWLR